MDTPTNLPPEHAAYVNQAVADAASPMGPHLDALNTADATPRAAPIPAQPLPGPSLTTQIGGSHYTKMKVQPLTFAMKNELGFVEGSVTKYVSRWQDKGGIPDLEKAIDMLQKYVAHLYEERAAELKAQST